MKLSISRTSRESIEAQDNIESPYPDIPETKWQEFVEKEETDMFLLEIREEIVNACLKICYENYMEKQCVSFTVHCAYLAWLKVIDMYYMFRDPGDTEDPKTKQTWEPDLEPEPSVIDSWGNQCIRIETPPVKKEEPKKEKEIEVTEFENEFSHVKPKYVVTPVSRMSSFVSEFFYGGEDYYPTSFSDSRSAVSSRKSTIFSKTLSMPRELLPMMTPVILCKKEKPEKTEEKNKR